MTWARPAVGLPFPAYPRQSITICFTDSSLSMTSMCFLAWTSRRTSKTAFLMEPRLLAYNSRILSLRFNRFWSSLPQSFFRLHQRRSLHPKFSSAAQSNHSAGGYIDDFSSSFANAKKHCSERRDSASPCLVLSCHKRRDGKQLVRGP